MRCPKHHPPIYTNGLGWEEQPDEKCMECFLYESGRTGQIIVETGAAGLGDALQGLAVVASLATETMRPITYKCGPAGIDACEMFHVPNVLIGRAIKQHVEDTKTKGARQLNAGYTRNESAGVIPPRWERYAANIGASGTVIPPLKNQAYLKASGLEFRGCVALCPFTHGPERDWGITNWVTLESILIEKGYLTVILHDATSPAVERFHGTKFVGHTIAEVAGVLLNVLVAIGIDSGLVHLAGMLKTPAIVIGAERLPRIFGMYPTVKTCTSRNLIDISARTVFECMLEYVQPLHNVTNRTGELTPELMDLTVERPDDVHVFREVITNDCYELHNLQLPQKPYIVDVGAHIGLFTAYANHLWPDSTIECVECCPENLSILRQNVANIATIHAKAMTYEIGDIALLNTNVDGGPSTCGSEVLPVDVLVTHVHNPNHYWRDYRELQKITLEEVVNGRKIDVLKLDCEGSEYSILDNATCLNQVSHIVGEWHGRAKFVELIRKRFAGWTLRVIHDGENGTFHLANTFCNNGT